MKIEKWEIWNADLRFEDNPAEVKRRPVLIIDHEKLTVVVLKITSKPPKEEFFGEYEISLWKEAGLDKPSVVRSTRRARIDITDLVSKRGKLQARDIAVVSQLLHFIDH